MSPDKDRAGLPASKPKSVWKKPLEAEIRPLFKALSKVAVDSATLQWADAAKAAAEALSAVGLQDKPNERAWKLVQRALLRAMVDLVGEQKALLRPQERDFSGLAEEIELSLEATTLTLPHDFFDYPRKLSILEDLEKPLGEWLVGAGLSMAVAKNVCDRLAPYFVYALHAEWQEHAKWWEPIRQALTSTPFSDATRREAAWRCYHAWLQRQVDEPLFGFESFSLRQVYVPLRGYFEREPEGKRKAGKQGGTYQEGREPKEKVVVELGAKLRAWLDEASPRDAVRVLSGGPGSGKSSTTKMFAAKQAERQDLRVLFIPLHLFKIKEDFEEALDSFLREDEHLAGISLDLVKSGERCLFIFDGLDELVMQGKAAQEAARDFLDKLLRKVDSWNAQKLRAQVLLSGRELVVQANQALLQKPKQVLHALPYLTRNLEGERFSVQPPEDTLIDPESLLKEDQRHRWWANLGTVRDTAHSAMPEVLGRRKLEEITAQPLLNYLVALSYERGEVDFSTETNLNAIYYDLIASVHKRDWAQSQHPAIRGVDRDSFLRLLEEIALAAWHGEGRTTTVREIEQRCTSAGLKRLLEVFQQGVEGGVTQLLTAFYFRQSGARAGGDKTFEFTHKSFGEYLAARRIVRAVERIARERQRRQDDPDDGWDERQALAHWAEICGPTVMDLYLYEFLVREVQKRPEARKWQEILGALFGRMLRHGMPMEDLTPRPSYHEESRRARNAEEALLAACSACARATDELTRVRWHDESACGEWLARTLGQRGREERLVLRCLNRLDMSHQNLASRDAMAANLGGSNLEGADLRGANLRGANLEQANLQRAELVGANLQRAQLEGASLARATLVVADLSQAVLYGADLQGADLRGTNLGGAKLQEANLRGADLEQANLGGANLQGVHLGEAELLHASLEGAVLYHADFDPSHLIDAYTEGCHFSDPNMHDHLRQLREEQAKNPNL